MKLLQEPGARRRPITLGGSGGDLECGCRFFPLQPAEEAQLDNLGRTRIESGERIECGIERDQVGLGAAGAHRE